MVKTKDCLEEKIERIKANVVLLLVTIEQIEKEVRCTSEPIKREWEDVPGVDYLSARYRGGYLEFAYKHGDSSISIIAHSEIPALIKFLQQFNT